MYETVHGLVVREVDYKESDKILTVLTMENGKITVSARSARKQSNPHAAASQTLVYSRMLLSEYKERLTLREAEIIEPFLPLRDNLDKMALGIYLCDAAQAFMPEMSPMPELLRLCLTALSLLSSGKRPAEIIKPAFEMAALCEAGYAPSLDNCAACSSELQGVASLDIPEGVAYCSDCAGERFTRLSAGVLDALRHLRSARPGKLFAFTLSNQDTSEIQAICERYLLTHTGHGFSSLDFYKSICK